MKKIGSVIKLNNKEIKLKIGTIDKKNPEVIYVEGCFYVKPIIKKEVYKNDINNIKSTFNDLIKEYLKKNCDFKNDYMFFVDIADKWIEFEKKSFLSFQIFLKPSDNIIKKEKNFNNVIEYLNNTHVYDMSFINDVFKDYGYELSKTKK